MLATLLPSGALSVLPASTQPLATVTLPKYRELLRKLKSHGSVEESNASFQQAKERVLLRLQQRRERVRVDPNGAFRRLRERAVQARRSLRQLKNEQKQRLRQYYYDALLGSSVAAVNGAVPGTAAAGALGLDASVGAGSSSGIDLEGVGVAALDRRGQQRRADLAAAADAAGDELDPEAVQRAVGPNGLFRTLVVAGVGSACKAFLHGASRTTVEGADIMRAALERPQGQALITVSNHVGSIDDPLITSAVVPAEYLTKPEAVRWTMCATDRCFKSKLLAPFFKAAKVLPVERGAGLGQFGMRVAQSRLAAGDWVHIFPEGTRSRTGKMLPVRKGVGWLVAQCEQPPLVVPFVHSGMEKILPKGAKLPKAGQEVNVLVGQPIEVADLLSQAQAEGWADNQLHLALTERVGQALYQLKARLEGVAVEEVMPQRAQQTLSVSEETLLPLIEDEMDSMLHRWRDSWHRSGLPSLTARVKQALREQTAAAYAAAAEVGGRQDGQAQPAQQPYLSLEGFLFGREAEPAGVGMATESDLLGGSVLSGSDGQHSAAVQQARQGLRQGSEDRPAPWMLRAVSGHQGVLRMLRGSGVEPARWQGMHSTLGGSPADPAASSSGGLGHDASGSTRLRQLMVAAADYSTERVQHMRHMLAVGGAQQAPEAVA
ncbi:hypothetical protein N2152v2_006560 [Parachlorella kessleri]